MTSKVSLVEVTVMECGLPIVLANFDNNLLSLLKHHGKASSTYLPLQKHHTINLWIDGVNT